MEGHVNGDYRSYSGLFRQHSENAPMARVFIPYSHADDELGNELEKHLAAIRPQRMTEVWLDCRIETAQDLKPCASILRTFWLNAKN